MELYTVRAGDTLPALARRFGCSPEALAHANHLSSRRLTPGLALLLPSEAGGGREALVFAYARPDIAGEILDETLPALSALCSFSGRLSEEGGLLLPENGLLPAHIRAGGAAPLLVLSNLTDSGGFSGRTAHTLLASPALQEAALDELLAFLDREAWAGAVFHLQYLFPFDREAYSRFIRRAAERLHEGGYLAVSALAPPEDAGAEGLLCGAQDCAAHGEAADYVILLSFEWGHPDSAPQALSPLPRVRRAVARAAALLPPGKLLMGLSHHGCRWRLPWRQGDEGAFLGSAAAQELGISLGAGVRYDESAAAAFFTCEDAAGERSVVWYEDARSLLARLHVAEEYGLAGVCLWTADRLYRPTLQLLRQHMPGMKIL